MYRVSIIDMGTANADEVIINDSYSNAAVPRITGTVKQGINSIDSFSFTIYYDNPGYNLIKPYRTLVKVYNIKTDKFEFIGRPITPSKQMEESGVFYKTYVCESVKGFLYDTMQEYGEFHNVSPASYFTMLINKHNEQSELYKRFKIGSVTVTDSNDSLYRYTAYESTYKNINDDLTNSLSGELVVEYGDGNAPWTIDLLSDYGVKSKSKIKMGLNMKSITEKLDFSDFGTRIIPLGAKIKTKDADGNEKETEERVTIKEVNNGKKYIDIPELINEYGIVEKVVEYDNVTLPKNLLAKGKKYAETMMLTISNTISAFDLSMLGYDYDSFKIGNSYRLEHAGLDIDYYARLIEKTIVIHDPKSNTLKFGDHGADFKEFFKVTANSINKIVSVIEDELKKIPSEVLAQAKIDASNLIKSCTEGNVVFHLNKDMKPYELLIMDTDDIETATSVWRFNIRGLAFSSSGYNGNYNTAITMKGEIVADFITAGTMSADRIRGGKFIAGGEKDGIIEVQDKTGNVLVKLDVTGIDVKKGKIKGASINDVGDKFYVNEAGYLHAEDGDIGGIKINQKGMGNNYPGYTYISSDGISSNTVSGGGSYLTSSGVRSYESTSKLVSSDGYGLKASGVDIVPVGSPTLGSRGNEWQTMYAQYVWAGGLGLQTHKNDYGDGNAVIEGSLTVEGAKSRLVSTRDFGKRKLHAYETPVPMFGDVGEGIIDDTGVCYIAIEDIFAETISAECMYQVLLQAYGDGYCYVSERNNVYFAVRGTPGLAFGWEIKAYQIDMSSSRLETYEKEHVINDSGGAQLYVDDEAMKIADAEKEVADNVREALIELKATENVVMMDIMEVEE